MITLTIFAMSLIVFGSRYIFIEPALPLKLNKSVKRLLSYSAPAVLTAILTPIVFLPEGELSLSWTNPYLLGAIATALVVAKSKNVLLAVFIGTLVFGVARYLL